MQYKLAKPLILSFVAVSFFFSYSCYSAPLPSSELLKILTGLKVESDCTTPPYSRKSWKHWVDANKDGQDTRQEVLIAESLIYPQLSSDSKKVIAGKWHDLYTNTIFTNPSDLDIDHLVPLGEAHRSGGCRWTEDEKKQFANFIMHEEELIAVSKTANREKGQKDPTQWLPKNEAYRCEYASNWIVIKARWDLWVDKAEQQTLQGLIETNCVDEVVISP
jgi:hypothetical protein